MLNRLFLNWVYGGTLAALVILLLTPLLCRSWSLALTLTFLHLPMYMLHQYEEHDDDRFRRFFNQHIGNGKEVLSPAAVFVVNVPLVWGSIAVATWLAADLNVGFGLIAVYLAVVNAIVHILHAALFRCYNPGLITAIVLFLPVGLFSLWQIHLAGGSSLLTHASGLGFAIVAHAGIIAWVKHRGAFGAAPVGSSN